ncbi:3-hydroxyacyl-CoA dehydrogenase family protein [Actinomadura chokoriensis]|uniref:3-hydroxyacyl-CoA dehydrogenase NAD-binding domain-containing protein n=1 Tax=Actinomadura chokoriensis TaxID=454156 RepID=A0ABV4QWY3_9ACTN
MTSSPDRAPLRTVGVVGAGTIGRGVAQSFAENGFEVALVDIEENQLKAAIDAVANDLRAGALLRRTSEAVDVDGVIARITTGTAMEALTDADFVVENVTEKWEVKEGVYREIDELCRADVTFAVNTSAIPVTRIASLTRRPARVLGMHFMNPVPLMDTVEVVRGHATSPETLDASLALLGRLGKRGVVVEDAPGFVTNRVLMLTINEAIFCVQDRTAGAADVDRIFTGCFGHRMGPLETADLIGLDTILNSLTVLYDEYRDCKFRPAPLLRKMVDAGLLGRKTKLGFHDYRLPSERPERRNRNGN